MEESLDMLDELIVECSSVKTEEFTLEYVFKKFNKIKKGLRDIKNHLKTTVIVRGDIDTDDTCITILSKGKAWMINLWWEHKKLLSDKSKAQLVELLNSDVSCMDPDELYKKIIKFSKIGKKKLNFHLKKD